MFDTRTRLFFFACLKDAAGAAFKNAAPAPGSDQKKVGSGAALKVAAPGGSATLLRILDVVLSGTFKMVSYSVLGLS